MCEHPIQPVITDENEVQRFKDNKVIKSLLSDKILDITERWNNGEFTNEDMQQVAQLGGYTVTSFCGLPFVDEKCISRVDDQIDGVDAVAKLTKRVEELELDIENKAAVIHKIKTYINRI